MKKSKVLIIAGGTGGHIYPGLSLYQVFHRFSSEDVLFLSIPRNKNYKELTKLNLYFYNAPRFSFKRKDLFLFLPLFFIAFLKVFYIIIREKVDILVGLGGYPTVPALLAGILLRKNIYMCEQNVIPGKVTVFFSKWARKIFFTFPPEEKYQIHFKDKIVLTGNPFREDLYKKAISIKRTSKSPQTIFITGGSQGARQLNEMLLNLWKKYPDFSKRYNWIIQTGGEHFSKYSEEIKRLSFSKNIHAFDFSHNIYQYFEKSEILICRAGAGNISEGILFSLPMILIPYPYATDNHQEANARFVEKVGCAEVILTKTNEPEILQEKLKLIIKKYKYYFKNIKSIQYNENPSEIIYKEISNDRKLYVLNPQQHS